MSLKSDGPGPFRWSHSEICTWLDASGYSAPVIISRSSRIVTATIARHKDTSDERQEETKSCVNGVVD